MKYLHFAMDIVSLAMSLMETKTDWNEQFQQLYSEYRNSIRKMYAYNKDWPKISDRYEISKKAKDLYFSIYLS